MKRFVVILATLAALVGLPALGQTTSDTGLAGKATTVAVTADNQAVSAAGFGVILLTSDNATATNRTFTLTASAIAGHRVTLVLDDTDAVELVDTGIQKLNGNWIPLARYASIELVSDGTNWIETSRKNATGLDDLALADAHILVGNSSSLAADVAVSGAVTISNTGATTLSGFTHTSEGLEKIEKVAVATYVFGTDGGASSTIGLGVTLPDNAVVTKVVRDNHVICDSGANDDGTIKLTLPTDGDIDAALTCDGSAVSVASVLPSGTPVKTTAARELSAIIATNDLTAGSITWFVYYVLSQ